MSFIVNTPKATEIAKTMFANDSVNKELSMPSNISSIHATGVKEPLPLNSEKNVNTSTPSMKKEALHKLNNQKQAIKIAELLSSNITADMVKKALNFDGMGDLEQQAINYRPESSLIILTLLEPHERVDGLLESAEKVVREAQDLNYITNDDNKKNLKSSLKQFDEKIQESLSGIKGDIFLIMGERFKEHYIKPEFENILKPHLSLDTIKQLSMDDCLLSRKNKEKQEKISVFNRAYQREGNTESVDKAHYMHSMFSVLEESLEIVKALKTTVDWQEHASLSNVESSPLQAADEVDGIRSLPQPEASPPSHTFGSNNTTNNYYFIPPFSESITKISSQNSEVSHASPEESKPNKQSEEPKADYELPKVKRQSIANSSRAAFSQPAQEPKVDYELPEAKNQSIANLSREALSQTVQEPEVDYKLPKVDDSIYQSKGFVVSTLRGTQAPVIKVNSERQSIKQEAIKQFLPKNGRLLGSYLKNGEVPTKVTLSTEGALTRHQSDKDIYRGTREATKRVDDTASYLRNGDTPVTLTERGALTRDQSKKDAYTTGQ